MKEDILKPFGYGKFSEHKISKAILGNSKDFYRTKATPFSKEITLDEIYIAKQFSLIAGTFEKLKRKVKTRKQYP